MSGGVEWREPPAKRRHPTSSHCTECGHKPEAPSATPNDETASSIWRLNKDCLLSLLHHLPKSDLNNMRLTCSKMRDLVDTPEIDKKRRSDRMSMDIMHHEDGRMSCSRELYLGRGGIGLPPHGKLREEYSIDKDGYEATTTVKRTRHTETSTIVEKETNKPERLARKLGEGSLPVAICRKLKEWMRFLPTIEMTFYDMTINSAFINSLIEQFVSETIDEFTFFACTFSDKLTEEDGMRFRTWLHERRCSYFDHEAAIGDRWRVIVTDQLLYLPHLRKFSLSDDMFMSWSEKTVMERFGRMDSLHIGASTIPRHLLPAIIKTLADKPGKAFLVMRLTGDQWTPEELMEEIGPRFATARPEQEYDFEDFYDDDLLLTHSSSERGFRLSNFTRRDFLVIEVASLSRA